MILITGTVVVSPESREAFLAAAERQVRASRMEAGRLDYFCGEDVMVPNTLSFLERGVDQAAVQFHFAHDHSRAFVDEVERLALNEPVVEIHEVAGSRKMTPGR